MALLLGLASCTAADSPSSTTTQSTIDHAPTSDSQFTLTGAVSATAPDARLYGTCGLEKAGSSKHQALSAYFLIQAGPTWYGFLILIEPYSGPGIYSLGSNSALNIAFGPFAMYKSSVANNATPPGMVTVDSTGASGHVNLPHITTTTWLGKGSPELAITGYWTCARAPGTNR
jgi:hypothetical protein